MKWLTHESLASSYGRTTMNPHEIEPTSRANEISDVSAIMDLNAELPPENITKKAPPPSTGERSAGGLWNVVVPCMFLMSLFVLVIYAIPYLVYHWRLMDAHADAEAVYMKRRAELKADAEHADQRLDLLDKRVQLTTLGFREVTRKVLPNVVSVVNLREPKKSEAAMLSKKSVIYDPDNERKYVQQGAGSGVIIKPGVILTNHHVVKDAQRLRIVFASGQSIGVDIDVVVSDLLTDLAVVRLPETMSAALKEESQHAAVFADSDKDVQVGDWALAMGSPLGLRQSVSQGIISAKGRFVSILDMVELLQTTAAINPGNSGGPLFDQLGRVIGINFAIASDTGGNQGIGFVIPSNVAKKISEQLLQKGEVSRGYLGIAMAELPGSQLKALKLDHGAILVKEVVAREAAEKAGIKAGDIIVRLNKEALHRLDPVYHFRRVVVDLEPGAEATLEIMRGEERLQMPVTIGKRPGNLN